MSWDKSFLLVAAKIIETWSVKLKLPTKKVKPTLILYFSFMLTISGLFYMLSETNTASLPISGSLFEIVLVLVFFMITLASLTVKISKQLVVHAQAFGTFLWVLQFGFCIFLLQNVLFTGETQNHFWLNFLGDPILFLVSAQNSVVFFSWFFCG